MGPILSARTWAVLALGALVGAGWPGPLAWGAAGRLELSVVDKATGEPVPCRMHLRAAKGRARKADGAPFWHDHFVFPGRISLALPLGAYEFEIERGPEYAVRSGYFTINPHADDAKEVDLQRFVRMAAEGWYAGDLFVRRPAKDIELLMQAEDLHAVPLLTWWNGQPEPQAKTAARGPLAALDNGRWCLLAGGALERPGGTYLVFPLQGAIRPAQGEGEYPSTAALLKRLRAQDDALWVDAARPYLWDLPMLVAHGQIDSIQVAHSGLVRPAGLAFQPDRQVTPRPDRQAGPGGPAYGTETDGKPRDPGRFPGRWGSALWSQHVYFQLLNCGLRIPPSAGSGSGAAPNPVGYNRVYVHVEGEPTWEKWWESFQGGRVVVTNGPLLRPKVHGQAPGYEFQAGEGEKVDLEIGLTLSTREPISYLEIVKDGRIEHSIPFAEYSKSGRLPKVVFDRSGWFLVRAVSDDARTYRFAMTGPYYVRVGGQARVSRSAAQFFLDWVYERARQIKLDDPEERREVLEDHRKARDFWEETVKKANAE